MTKINPQLEKNITSFLSSLRAKAIIEKEDYLIAKNLSKLFRIETSLINKQKAIEFREKKHRVFN